MFFCSNFGLSLLPGSAYSFSLSLLLKISRNSKRREKFSSHCNDFICPNDLVFRLYTDGDFSAGFFECGGRVWLCQWCFALPSMYTASHWLQLLVLRGRLVCKIRRVTSRTVGTYSLVCSISVVSHSNCWHSSVKFFMSEIAKYEMYLFSGIFSETYFYWLNIFLLCSIEILFR